MQASALLTSFCHQHTQVERKKKSLTMSLISLSVCLASSSDVSILKAKTIKRSVANGKSSLPLWSELNYCFTGRWSKGWPQESPNHSLPEGKASQTRITQGQAHGWTPRFKGSSGCRGMEPQIARASEFFFSKRTWKLDSCRKHLSVLI